ncbi:DUF2572 family protein [Conservatibacter flavescens]|uniref:DUF2572 domain-containing protein n=1 Tax=Conservatibacter flavescens TaxID=28161 RepID=A0A2M8S0G2_9PAST|nr:DUF2572 family protein [Conservatibacter flavescens]PJG84608.1 DUF2572 domain-containing protein [Conservatibacter flavescens]
MKRYYSGMMTLNLLMLLSGFLMLMILFDDDVLRLQMNLVAQRSLYAQNNATLQQQSQTQGQLQCENLSLNLSTHVEQISFEQQIFQGGVKHFIWCERQSLFKRQPRQGILENTLESYINTDIFPIFAQDLAAQSQIEKLYWFSETNTEFELTGNVRGIIVAQGNLRLTGKGEFRGAIITGGKLQYPDTIRIAYNSRTVSSLVKYFSRWRLAEKSWHDFTPA